MFLSFSYYRRRNIRWCVWSHLRNDRSWTITWYGLGSNEGKTLMYIHLFYEFLMSSCSLVFLFLMHRSWSSTHCVDVSISLSHLFVCTVSLSSFLFFSLLFSYSIFLLNLIYVGKTVFVCLCMLKLNVNFKRQRIRLLWWTRFFALFL